MWVVGQYGPAHPKQSEKGDPANAGNDSGMRVGSEPFRQDIRVCRYQEEDMRYLVSAHKNMYRGIRGENSILLFSEAGRKLKGSVKTNFDCS